MRRVLALAAALLAAAPARSWASPLSERRAVLLGALTAEDGDARRKVVDVAELALNPRAYRDAEVAVLGIPFNIADDGGFLLGDGFGLGPYVPVSGASLPAALKAELGAFRARGSVLLVRGTLRDGSPSPGFKGPPFRIEASDFLDLGETPPNIAMTVSEVLRGKPVVAADPAAAIAALKADAATRFSPVEGLAGLSGQAVAVLGFPYNALTDRAGRFQLWSKWASSESVTVSMDALPLERKKELLRVMFPPHLIALKGRVGAAPGGNVRLEAAEFTVLGEVSGERSLAEAVAQVSKPRPETPLLSPLLKDDPAQPEGCGCACLFAAGEDYLLSNFDLSGAWFNVAGRDMRLEPVQSTGLLTREVGSKVSRVYEHAGMTLRLDAVVTEVPPDAPGEESWDASVLSAVLEAKKGARTQRLPLPKSSCGCGC